MKNTEEETEQHHDAQISGRTEGPYGTDGTDVDTRVQDNRNREIVEDSANGLDSVQVRGGQDGRNDRGIGSMDMDSKNGVLRMGDMGNSTMEVTEEGLKNAAADDPQKTRTSTVDAPDQQEPRPDEVEEETPNAKQETRQQSDDPENPDSSANKETEDEQIARTGTSIEHKPTY